MQVGYITEDDVKSLNKMEKAAIIIKQKGKNVVLGSMDVVRLYPNLDIRKSARAVGEAAASTYIEVVEITAMDL